MTPGAIAKDLFYRDPCKREEHTRADTRRCLECDTNALEWAYSLGVEDSARVAQDLGGKLMDIGREIRNTNGKGREAK